MDPHAPVCVTFAVSPASCGVPAPTLSSACSPAALPPPGAAKLRLPRAPPGHSCPGPFRAAPVRARASTARLFPRGRFQPGARPQSGPARPAQEVPPPRLLLAAPAGLTALPGIERGRHLDPLGDEGGEAGAIERGAHRHGRQHHQHQGGRHPGARSAAAAGCSSRAAPGNAPPMTRPARADYISQRPSGPRLPAQLGTTAAAAGEGAELTGARLERPGGARPRPPSCPDRVALAQGGRTGQPLLSRGTGMGLCSGGMALPAGRPSRLGVPGASGWQLCPAGPRLGRPGPARTRSVGGF